MGFRLQSLMDQVELLNKSKLEVAICLINLDCNYIKTFSLIYDSDDN